MKIAFGNDSRFPENRFDWLMGSNRNFSQGHITLEALNTWLRRLQSDRDYWSITFQRTTLQHASQNYSRLDTPCYRAQMAFAGLFSGFIPARTLLWALTFAPPHLTSWRTSAPCLSFSQKGFRIPKCWASSSFNELNTWWDKIMEINLNQINFNLLNSTYIFVLVNGYFKFVTLNFCFFSKWQTNLLRFLALHVDGKR